MKKILYLIFACSLFIPEAVAQKVEPGPLANELLKETHNEKIYLHFNSSLLFPGEYLLFKVYNLNEENIPSELSEVAYVELIGEEGNRVFKQKIDLQESTGQADFFIPTTVPSGNYKLVSYTNWMRNTGNFFKADITIINPYQSRQAALEDSEEAKFQKDEDVQKLPEGKNSVLEIELNKSAFAPREKVVLRLKKVEKGIGNLSLSVRRAEKFGVKDPITAEDYIQSMQTISESIENAVYLPELRGQLYQGRIVPLDSVQNNSLKNRKIAISLPAEGLVPKTAKSDEKGYFFFNLDKDASAEKAALEVLGKDRDQYSIQLVDEPAIDPADLQFSSFKLSPAMEELILTRSVHNQIENSYFAVKPDTVVTAEPEKPFYENIAENYDLDDYTRFKTIPETFIEIINSAWIRKDESGKSVFAVRGLSDNIDMNLLPLVSIDGVLIQDHEDLINMNPKEIKNIRLIRDKLYVGAEVFQGAVLAETIEGDYIENHSKPYTTKVELMRPAIRKKYFQQEYDQNSDLSRVPDYRYQLLWEPDLEMKNREQEIHFFTSDVPGEYEVSIEGFTENGEPVTLKKTFTVEKNN